ncbi:MAG: ABC transporter permease [Butyrivibrio sp.]|nr:ABC transporter permease [Acetatifactor muris]MCM1560845.1 ABC transporter permease [Butyrivibrio sp.]
MNKLLKAGFTRLRKSRIFWLMTLFSVCWALFVIYTQYSDMKRYQEVIETEQVFLFYATTIGIVISIFTSLFLGVEYSDGTIRNKIIIGCKRADIYLSNLMITSAAALYSYLLYIAIVAAIGIPLFGSITIPVSKLLMTLGCVFAVVIAYSGIFTFAAMMISNKAITAIVSVLLAFGMMMAALTCFSILEAPEVVPSVSFVDGEMKTEEIQNPKYPSEEKRKVCQILLDINPAGQMYQLGGRDVPDLKVLPIYSLGEFIVFAGAGILLFRKKELK